MTTLTPLEPWIRRKIGLPATEHLNRPALEEYQLRRLRETVGYAICHSPFYRDRLGGLSEVDIVTLADLGRFPFTYSADICKDDLRFLCVSQREIERVVTLKSSGTTAPSKRLHFTAEDLEQTVDFFHHGMSTLVGPGDRVLILMPGELPGSVGDLLVKGLFRMDLEGIVRWPLGETDGLLDFIASKGITSLVGLPGHLLRVVRHPKAAQLTKGQIGSVLLSADYVPEAVVRELKRVWGCLVFNHYGMTEMGLGGGVDCRALSGYHLREVDLLFEIVDPVDGRPLPEGETGEVVFTTLTRKGMPLIRYRTGDMASFITESCTCGAVLRRLGHVRGRLETMVEIAGCYRLDCSDLSESLYSVPEIIDFQAELSRYDGTDLLALTILLCNAAGKDTIGRVKTALMDIPQIRDATACGKFIVDPIFSTDDAGFPQGTTKKTILDLRHGGSKK